MFEDHLLGQGQYLFRSFVQSETQRTLSQIGLQRFDSIEVFTIGLATQEGKCQILGVDPLSGPISSDDLQSVESKLDLVLKEHPESDLSIVHPGPYGRRENLRIRRCRALAIAEAIDEAGKLDGYAFFVSDSTHFGDHEIHVCIGLPKDILESVPGLFSPITDQYGTGRQIKSFAHATIHTCLESADMALYLPDPGRKSFVLESRTELIRRSAERFVNNVALSLSSPAVGLFSVINEISSQTYERSNARGQLLVTNHENLQRNLDVTLRDPVSLLDTRSIRKMLELTDETTALLADGRFVYGLGMCDAAPCVAKVEIKGNFEWSLSTNDEEVIKVSHQQATLPKPILDRNHFKVTAHNALSDVETEPIWNAVQYFLDSGHGTTIIVSSDPASEIDRLGQTALAIEAKPLNPNELARLGRIDGAVFLDPNGCCYAFGVILDGRAGSAGNRSRGARYNSAIRYEQTADTDTLAIVVSDDGMVNLIPPPIPRKPRTEVESAVQSYYNYSMGRDVDDHEWVRLDQQVREFGPYLSLEQCWQVNRAYEHIKRLRQLNDKTIPHRDPLRLNPYLDDSYFTA